MTFDEGLQRLAHNVEEALHEVEDAFLDVKEHMILSVRNHTYMIAFFLMSVTSAILVFGTVYVWCFHHGHRAHDETDEDWTETETENESPESNTKSKKRVRRKNENDATGTPDVSKTQKSLDEVRKRIPSADSPSFYNNSGASNGTGVNNNNSPVKSRIPVRRRTSTQS